MINKIEQMKKLGDPGRSSGMGDILRDRIVKLAGELQENERENIKLRAELAAECKKREEAEADVYKLGQENIELEADLSATKKKCDEYREMANKVQIGGESFQLQFLAEEEDKCRGLEIQVEVLREGLEEIAQADGTPDNKIHVSRSALISIAKKSLANLPARAEAIGKVLEVAEEQARLGAETHCDNHSVYFAACADTNKAVSKWRKK